MHIALPQAVTVAPFWRRRPASTAALVLFALLSAWGRGEPSAGGDFNKYHNQVFTVVYVADGDTIDIDLPDGKYAKTRIRLWGVDTPEVAGSRDGAMHFGAQASAFAKKTLLGSKVRIVLNSARTRDKYNRLLAYVYLEPTGDSYNEMLVRKGLAYADWRFRHPLKSAYKLLERRARKSRVGLWAEVTPEGMPEWRRRMERELNYSPP